MLLRLMKPSSRVRPRASRVLLLSLLVFIAIAPSASAIEIAGVSHRTRLYDSAAHGKDVFVVGHPGTLLRSSDQGKHFTPVTVPSQDALFSIDFNRSGLGAIVGRSALVLITSDGGGTWTKTQALAAKEGEERPHLFSVDVLETGTIVAVGDFATIVYSTDRGKTWSKASIDASEPAAAEEKAGRGGLPNREEHENAGFEDEARLTGVSFGDDQHGFVVGEFGIVMGSEDGGRTWKRQHSATDKLLFSVDAVSGKRVVASGSDGTIVETKDGRTWAVVATPIASHLFGVWASDDLIVAVGADGAVIRRSGSSGPFQVIPTHVHTWLSSVELYDGTHGVIAGGLGHLLGTDNAGQSFSHLTGE